LLELDPLDAKLRRLIEWLQHELTVRELGQKITSETRQRMSKAQRDFFLREPLHSIQHELGKGEENPELAQLRERLESAALPEEALREAQRELDRLSAIPPVSPEYLLIRTYLDWMVSLPWSALSGGEIDVHRAREVLDADHYDLDKVKDRILEPLAVEKLRKERAASGGAVGELGREPILCSAGRRVLAKPVSDSPSRGRSRGNSSACHWVSCGTRPRSADIGAAISALSPDGSSRASGAPKRVTRCSCSTRSTKSAPTGAAIPRRRCSRSSIPPKITTSSTTIWASHSICRRYCS
jgi:hypothetical protein